MSFLDRLPLYGPWRIKRDATKYYQWLQFLQTQSRGAQIFEIVRIRKAYPKKGLKAWGRWLNGETSAVWIPDAWPNVGTFVSAIGGYDHGKHHDEPVFFVNQLICDIGPEYYNAMRRHIARPVPIH